MLKYWERKKVFDYIDVQYKYQWHMYTDRRHFQNIQPSNRHFICIGKVYINY